jgi:hypothetical protein
LNDTNIELIAKEAVKASNNSSYGSLLEVLIKQLKSYEKEQAILMQAVAECPIETVRQSLYEKLGQVLERKKELETQLAIENNKASVNINEEQIIFFLNKLKKGDPNDKYNRKALISVFVIAIYLYDDPDKNKKITYVLSVNGKPVEITETILADIESKASLCSYTEQTSEPH